MTLAVALVIVWALVTGISPGLALVAIAVTGIGLDRHDPTLIDRLLGRQGA